MSVLDALGGTLNVAVVAQLSRGWRMANSVTHELIARGENADIAYAEPLVHEVVHAVQFGLAVHRDMADAVARRFESYKSKHMSDLAECTGLAIERIVFEELGWLARFDEIIDLAIADFKTTMTPAQAKWHIDRAGVMPVNARRAGHVIAELWALTSTGPAPTTLTQERVSPPTLPVRTPEVVDASWLVLARPTAMCEG